MNRNVLFFVLCFVVTVIPLFAYADDTDVYNIAQDVRPNVLIIFDNSGSMANGIPYDDATTYSGAYQTDTIYQRECVEYGWWWCIEWGWVEYAGAFTDSNLDGIHDTNNNIKRGNRLNYDTGTSGNRLAVAKTAVKDVIDKTKDYVRFGIMVLNGAQDINDYGVTFDEYHNDTTVLSTGQGGNVIDDRTDAQIETLKDYIDDMTASGGTPLANRLINAAKYFRGDFGSYDSPIDSINWCRNNFIILMTDGQPEGEGNSLSADDNGEYDHIEDFLDANAGTRDFDSDGNDPTYPAGGYINGGSDYLDDVTKYLHDTDDSLDLIHAIQGNQNLTVFTIGFTVDHQLLADTAANGGGNYYTASNSEELAQALIRTLTTIIEGAQIFTAPVVPVQRTTSGDKIYLSLFSPKTDESFWPGYLLKLNINVNGIVLGYASDYGTGTLTNIVDANGDLYPNILNPLAPPYPQWDAQHTLRQRDFTESPRDIYTYLGTSNSLNDTSNVFNTTNIDAGLLDVDAADVADLINYIYGLDAYDEDEDTVVDEKREYILGDILHSQPLVIDYSANPTSPQRVLYVGTNDGMLHAFDDTDGSEKWAFIPPDLLPKLKNMVGGTTHQYYVDGSPSGYIKDVDNDGNVDTDDDRVIIIFGERMGGTCYYALDVTDPDDPQFLWRIDNTVTGFEELGQSWSEPVIGKVKVGTTPTIVAFIGGGYNADDPNTKGRGLYIINVLTGAKVADFTFSASDPVLSHMTYCIPSTVAAVDTNDDRYINRVYVGDTGGQMWRFAVHRENSSDTTPEDGNVDNWSARLLFQAGSERKIFYRPDMALEHGYAYLFFGTGDRNNPGETAVTNRFYAVKDRNETVASFSTLGESDLVDLTSNAIQDDPTSTEATEALVGLITEDGWYIIMDENSGEKVLATPLVFAGVLLYETFTPNTDVCSYGGTGRVYAVDYLNATAVLDLNESTEGLDKTDRQLVIGAGIPTEVVVFISGGGANVRPRWLVGTGGGLGGAAEGGALSCEGPDCECAGDVCVCTGPICCTGSDCECTGDECHCTGEDCCIGENCCVGPGCFPEDAKLFLRDGWKEL